MTKTTRGSCNCGGVKWEAEGALADVMTCHCKQCRKQSGHYYAVTNAPHEKLRIDGEENLTWYFGSEEAARGFCSICGSAMFWKHEGRSYMCMLAGTIDGDSGLKVSEHIFVEDKGDYYSLEDGIPQRAQY